MSVTLTSGLRDFAELVRTPSALGIKTSKLSKKKRNRIEIKRQNLCPVTAGLKMEIVTRERILEC